MKLISRVRFVIVSFLVLFTIQSFGQNDKSDKSPQTILELKAAIEKVMEEEKIPAVGIAMVDENGPVWIASLGKANVEKDIDADENTMFRIGSTSKMFTALAILKLEEEGRLSLKDKVRDLIPEIEFENPWADEAPILVEHLIEHTTGWDNMHFIEFAHSDSIPISNKDALDFHPQSRVSRWMPGSRFAYCNTGPQAAGYIVEKITGMKFEEYVQQTLFNPLGMESATYFRNENFIKHGIATYRDSIPAPYWHILTRPSGAINVTPTDMAKFLMFYLNRGKVDSLQLISEESLNRMETCKTTDGARSGLEVGYGLANYTDPYKSFIYRGHMGSVQTALSRLGYLKDYKLGYSILINSNNYVGHSRIEELVREFQTNGLPEKEINIKAFPIADVKDISGYYVNINSNGKRMDFLTHILSVKKIWQSNDTIYSTGLFGGEIKKNIPVSKTQYRSTVTGKINLAQAIDPLDGDVLAFFDVKMLSEQILKPISALSLFGQLAILVLWFVFMLVSILYGIIWIIGYFMGKIETGANIKIRLWPLIASLFFIVSVILFQVGMGATLVHFGGPGLVSISLMIATIGFGLASVMSVVCVIKERKVDMNKIAYWYSTVLSVLHFLVAFYLFMYGAIGIRMWT